MYYLSALMAVAGALGYQLFVKRIPAGIDPLVSIGGVYILVLFLSAVLLALLKPTGGILPHLKQLGWIQIGIAVSVLFIELGFLLMYRFGWSLGAGNLITGTVANLGLVAIGVFVLGEDISPQKAAGIAFCLLGVTLIGR